MGKRPQPSRVGKKGVTVYLPESTWRELKVLAAMTDTTITALIRRGIERILAERVPAEPKSRRKRSRSAKAKA
jgi:hypothetical protein